MNEMLGKRVNECQAFFMPVGKKRVKEFDKMSGFSCAEPLNRTSSDGKPAWSEG